MGFTHTVDLQKAKLDDTSFERFLSIMENGPTMALTPLKIQAEERRVD